MAKHRLLITHYYDFPVEPLFNYFCVHENLIHLYPPAQIRLIKAGKIYTNGEGSIRKIQLPLFPIALKEVVTAFEPNIRIEYKLTGFSPFRGHRGSIHFTNLGQRSRIEYHMWFDGKLPGIAPVLTPILSFSIRRALKRLTVLAKSNA